MSKEIDPEKTQTAGEDLPEVEQELSQVATNPKQSMLILVGIFIVFIYLFFNLFISSDDSDADKDTTPVPDEIAKPIQVDSDSDVPSIPTLPSPPKLEDPTPPPPPPEAEPLPLAEDALPALPSEPSLPTITESSPSAPALPFGRPQDDEANKRMEAKRKSAIVLVAGTPAKKSAEQLQQEADFKYR